MEGTDKIFLKNGDGSAIQLWRFQRQEDNSYFITSCYDGRALEMTDGIRASGTQVSAHELWNGGYQAWYLLNYNGTYIIKSKHFQDEEWVLDLRDNVSDDGAVIQIASKNEGSSQIWSIYRQSDVQLSGPVLQVIPGDSLNETSFFWNRSNGVKYYNLRIYKDIIYEGQDYSAWSLMETNHSAILPSGTYYAYADAINYHNIVAGDTITFTIPEAYQVVLDYNNDENKKETLIKQNGTTLALPEKAPVKI